MDNRTKIQTILRCAGTGYTKVLRSPDGEKYAALLSKNFKEHTEYEQIDIKHALLLEIYGEYPLSQGSQSDWDNTMKFAFDKKLW